MNLQASWEHKNNTRLTNQMKLMHGIMAPFRSSLNSDKMTSQVTKTKTCKCPRCLTPEPAIRILKRSSNLARGQVIGGSHTKPLKAFEQRKNEYEQARLRILGEALSPEDFDYDFKWVHNKFEAFGINEPKKYK